MMLRFSGAQEEVLEVCICNHETNYATTKMKGVWILRIWWTSIQLCWKTVLAYGQKAWKYIFESIQRTYFRNASPLEPIRSYSPSYEWCSIVSARSLVSKRLIKRVELWSSISVLNNP